MSKVGDSCLLKELVILNAYCRWMVDKEHGHQGLVLDEGEGHEPPMSSGIGSRL